MQRSKKQRYSITSSARVKSVGGYLKAERFGGSKIDNQLEFSANTAAPRL